MTLLMKILMFVVLLREQYMITQPIVSVIQIPNGHVKIVNVLILKLNVTELLIVVMGVMKMRMYHIVVITTSTTLITLLKYVLAEIMNLNALRQNNVFLYLKHAMANLIVRMDLMKLLKFAVMSKVHFITMHSATVKVKVFWLVKIINVLQVLHIAMV